jgi:hypothetical protein
MNLLRAVAAALRRLARGTLSCRDARVLLCVSAAEPIALAALGYGSIGGARRVLSRLRPLVRHISGCVDEDRVAWALDVRQRWLPAGSTCLGRALVAECLLNDLEPLMVVIGIAAGEGGFRSHAWIERSGHIVVGGNATDDYVRMLAWSSSTP